MIVVIYCNVYWAELTFLEFYGSRGDTINVVDMALRISELYKRMAHACMRAGRETHAVRMIAVSKTVPASQVRRAYDAGIREFGENRIQEAEGKMAELGDLVVNWHMIGHLQSNKVKSAVRLFDVIHSVDSLKLMRLIDRHAGEAHKVQRILIQVKLSEEESKSGVDESGLGEMMDASASLKNIRVEGLMAVPPFFDDPEDARPYFRRLKDLADGFGLWELSMGMTGDFEAAIQEGATMIRVGSAIFGERDYR